MTGFLPKLLSVDLSTNYLEAGETLYMTLRWQNMGDCAYPAEGKVTVDLIFDRDRRHMENLTDGFRTVWTPAPGMYRWEPGLTVGTTGTWKVPQTWCGSFRVTVGLEGDDGEKLPFLGREGKPVWREDLTDIDLGWGWGHTMLVAQRRPVHLTLAEACSRREQPFEGETLRVGELLLDPSQPAAVGLVGGARWASCPPVVTACRTDTHEVFRCLKPDQLPRFGAAEPYEGGVRYRIEGIFGTILLDFSEREGQTLLSAECLSSGDRCEAVSLFLPRVAVFSEEGSLINFFCGGRSVPIRENPPFRSVFRYDVCNAMAGWDNGTALAVTADDMESVLIQSVEELGGVRQGVIGCELTLLIPALSDGAVSLRTPKLPIMLCRLPEGSWEAFAKLLRSRLPEGKMSLYDNTLFYKISVDKTLEADENRPETCSTPLRFPQVRQIIEKIYHITGGMRQVVYLVGWQRKGHDTEYPFPHRYGFTPKLGSFAEWEECRAFAKEHNAILSFHDNFDDAYVPEETAPGLIATDRRGRLCKGWLWAGGMSYILSPKAYNLSGEMAARVEETLRRFGIEFSYHLDVLTSEARRYDFSPACPSCALENVGYKKKIVGEFERYGVDVTSEDLTLPFIGVIEYALHTRYHFGERLFPTEKVIPLTTMLFHGRVRYGMGAVGKRERLYAAAYGATCGLDCVGASLGRDQIDCLYLHDMPMQLLARREVLTCREEGERLTVFYEGDSAVEADFGSGSFRIIADGRTVTEDGLTILPAFDGSGDTLVYSDRDRTVGLPCSEKAVTVSSLGFEGVIGCGEALPQEGMLTLQLTGGVPVRVSTKSDRTKLRR